MIRSWKSWSPSLVIKSVSPSVWRAYFSSWTNSVSVFLSQKKKNKQKKPATTTTTPPPPLPSLQKPWLRYYILYALCEWCPIFFLCLNTWGIGIWILLWSVRNVILHCREERGTEGAPMSSPCLTDFNCSLADMQLWVCMDMHTHTDN